jgi:hypothetical protein
MAWVTISRAFLTGTEGRVTVPVKKEAEMELPIAIIIGVEQVRRQFAECAPDAPALPVIERPPRARRTRSVSARALIRLARAIAPPEAVSR